jgi:hypothetical protein
LRQWLKYPSHSSASLEHLEILIERIPPAPLAAGDLVHGDGQPEGDFSNFRPRIIKAVPAFQILAKVAHQTTIKKLNGWISVGYVFGRANLALPIKQMDALGCGS